MSKFKVGDKVVLVDSRNNPNVLQNGVTGIVLFSDDDITRVQFNIKELQELHNGGELGEDGKCWTVTNDEIELLKPKSTTLFKTSNRYKLHKYILSTGFTKQDLSLALNKNQSYLTTETRESQFINRGDMSDARYKSLRKQIKEAVYKITTEFANSVPTNVGISSGEVIEILSDIEPQEKTIDEKVKEAKEALDTFTAPKPSNNGAFILGLVFFVMLIIFGIGCLIYKAA